MTGGDPTVVISRHILKSLIQTLEQGETPKSSMLMALRLSLEGEQETPQLLTAVPEISKREFFAGMALAGRLAREGSFDMHATGIAAYDWADLMIQLGSQR